MEVELTHRTANTLARVSLGRGGTCIAEGGVMVVMKGNVGIETTTMSKGGGGVLRGLRRVFSGESYFLNHFTAQSDGCEVWFAPTLPGDLYVLDIGKYDGVGGIIAQGGSFICSDPSVEMNLDWQGVRSLFAGEGVFWQRFTGSGKIVLCSFGSIYEVDVDGEYVVDSGHIVAFEGGLKFHISKAGHSWLGSFFGGEGFVCRFNGRGKVLCQSHQPGAFGGELKSYLRAR